MQIHMHLQMHMHIHISMYRLIYLYIHIYLAPFTIYTGRGFKNNRSDCTCRV